MKYKIKGNYIPAQYKYKVHVSIHRPAGVVQMMHERYIDVELYHISIAFASRGIS
jgi:hypothetical protein